MKRLELVKIDRFFAWLLFVSMLLFFFSGYGITKGIISSQLAIIIHNQILPPIAIISFTVHAGYAIHLAFKRWKFWNPFSITMLGLFFISFFTYFIYLQYFYQRPGNTSPTNQTGQIKPLVTDATDKSTLENKTNSTESPETRSFTLSELAKFDGKNGQPAYVAVDGYVYDLSSVFISGKHYSHYAGKELTTAFYSYHVKSAISKYPVVGTLTK